MERIAAAVERREAALEKAHDALHDQPDADESLGVGADAVEAGVSQSVLKTLAQSAPRDRRNVAIAALTELVQQGHPSEAALERVRDALRRGPDALANLPAEAASHRDGQGPSGHSSGDSARSGQGTPPAVPAPGQGPGSNSGPGSASGGSGSGGSSSGGSSGSSGNSGPGRPGR
jgi:hypothetical protein